MDAANVVSLFLCLQWFRWMCFGVECGLCVGCCVGLLWFGGAEPPPPSYGTLKLFALALLVCEFEDRRVLMQK